MTFGPIFFSMKKLCIILMTNMVRVTLYVSLTYLKALSCSANLSMRDNKKKRYIIRSNLFHPLLNQLFTLFTIVL